MKNALFFLLLTVVVLRLTWSHPIPLRNDYQYINHGKHNNTTSPHICSHTNTNQINIDYIRSKRSPNVFDNFLNFTKRSARTLGRTLRIIKREVGPELNISSNFTGTKRSNDGTFKDTMSLKVPKVVQNNPNEINIDYIRAKKSPNVLDYFLNFTKRSARTLGQKLRIIKREIGPELDISSKSAEDSRTKRSNVNTVEATTGVYVPTIAQNNLAADSEINKNFDVTAVFPVKRTEESVNLIGGKITQLTKDVKSSLHIEPKDTSTSNPENSHITDTDKTKDTERIIISEGISENETTIQEASIVQNNVIEFSDRSNLTSTKQTVRSAELQNSKNRQNHSTVHQTALVEGNYTGLNDSSLRYGMVGARPHAHIQLTRKLLSDSLESFYEYENRQVLKKIKESAKIFKYVGGDLNINNNKVTRSSVNEILNFQLTPNKVQINVENTKRVGCACAIYLPYSSTKNKSSYISESILEVAQGNDNIFREILCPRACTKIAKLYSKIRQQVYCTHLKADQNQLKTVILPSQKNPWDAKEMIFCKVSSEETVSTLGYILSWSNAIFIYAVVCLTGIAIICGCLICNVSWRKIEKGTAYSTPSFSVK